MRSEREFTDEDQSSLDSPAMSGKPPWWRRFRSWIWMIRGERVFRLTLPIAFVVMVLLASTEGIGFENHPIDVERCNEILPLFWWPYYFPQNLDTYCGPMPIHCHLQLMSQPFEYASSVIWWFILALITALLTASAWKKRNDIKNWAKSELSFLILFSAFLCILILLAHTKGIGYDIEMGSCCRGVCVAWVYPIVVMNWIFWWPFPAVGIDCLIEIDPSRYPHLHAASLLWWSGLSFLFAKLATWAYRKMKGKLPRKNEVSTDLDAIESEKR